MLVDPRAHSSTVPADILPCVALYPGGRTTAPMRPIGERARAGVVWTADVGAANNDRREEVLRPHGRLPEEASA
jgi:hypothetical protein